MLYYDAPDPGPGPANRGTTMRWKTDCRHYAGDRPCPVRPACRGCPAYAPWRRRWLVIKLAARGDVLRTTPLALAVKQQRPGAQVTWLTDPGAAPLLRHNPSIDRLLEYGPGTTAQLLAERFDAAVCLDKEPRAAALASVVRARAKYGFGWGADGGLRSLHRRSDILLDLGLSDDLKFRRNGKSYQRLAIEACGLRPARQPYQYVVTAEERARAGRLLRRASGGRGAPLIGLNLGTGRAFPTKAWPEAHFIALARAVRRARLGAVVLLGGPDEAGAVRRLRAAIPGATAAAPSLDLRDFAAVIGGLDVVVSADSLAMHLGIALRRKVVALFGPTCSQEIDLYGRGVKIAAAAACAPCYRAWCRDRRCMEGIKPAAVLEALRRLLAR